VWARTYEVKVISGVRMIQRLVPEMRGRGWGRVTQIGGGLAIQPMSAQPHYNAICWWLVVVAQLRTYPRIGT
jgi:NAD(P)-dependent dehydrogenase (short-subunit alcohol dehydrogenase family)